MRVYRRFRCRLSQWIKESLTRVSCLGLIGLGLGLALALALALAPNQLNKRYSSCNAGKPSFLFWNLMDA